MNYQGSTNLGANSVVRFFCFLLLSIPPALSLPHSSAPWPGCCLMLLRPAVLVPSSMVGSVALVHTRRRRIRSTETTIRQPHSLFHSVVMGRRAPPAATVSVYGQRNAVRERHGEKENLQHIFKTSPGPRPPAGCPNLMGGAAGDAPVRPARRLVTSNVPYHTSSAAHAVCRPSSPIPHESPGSVCSQCVGLLSLPLVAYSIGQYSGNFFCVQQTMLRSLGSTPGRTIIIS